MVFPTAKDGDIEESESGDIGHPLDLFGSGREGSGATTRDELQVTIRNDNCHL